MVDGFNQERVISLSWTLECVQLKYTLYFPKKKQKSLKAQKENQRSEKDNQIDWASVSI